MRINIEILINIGKLNDNDYIIFPDIKDINDDSRYIYLYSFCNKKINENTKLTVEMKEKFSMYLKLERKLKKFKFKSIDDSIILDEFNVNISKRNYDLKIDNNNIMNNFGYCKEDDDCSQISEFLINKFGKNFNNDLLSYDLKENNFNDFEFNEEYEIYDKKFIEREKNDLLSKKEDAYEKNQKINDFKQEIFPNYQISITSSKIKSAPLLNENINEMFEINCLNKLKLTLFFEEMNLMFIDDPFSENEYLLYPNESNISQTIFCLNSISLGIYKRTKLKTRNMIYPNLIVKKISENNFRIEAIENIIQGTLLFEIGGKVVTEDHLNLNNENKYFGRSCFFPFYQDFNGRNTRYILIEKKGNIGYFLQKTDAPLKNNVILRAYVNAETNKICLLCITCRKIKKGETLIVLNTKY